MHDQAAQQQLITGVVALAAAAFVVRRTLRPQTVRVYTLIVAPVLLTMVAVLIVAATPPATPLGVIIVGAGVVLGAALGYARARHSHVRLGPRPRTLTVAGNGILVAILLAAFAARTILRVLFAHQGALSVAISDAVLLFALASVAVARGMMFFTWRRLSAAPPLPSGAP